MRAARDLTRAQFQAELKRQGFRQVLLWFEDTTGEVSVSYGAIMHRTGKIARRATLAHLIRSRRADAAKQRAA